MSTPGRWQRKYKFIFVVLFVILSVQLLLGYQSSKLDDYEQGTSGEAHLSHLSGGSFPIDDDDGHQGGHPQRQLNSNGGKTHADENKDPPKRKRQNPDNLSFPVKCEVQSKDALSAVSRARSDECKKKILDTVCAIESGTFYAHQLVSRCPRGNFTRGRSLGCFQDDQTNRLLSGYYVNNKGNNSPQKCIEYCLQSGFTYAGVQYGSECFCGHVQPPSTAKLADSRCTKKCPGEEGHEEVCGGYFTMNVYETGISSE